MTSGGSSYFDQVVEVLGAPWPDGLPVLPVLRSGAYVTHDHGFYDRMSPLGASPRIDGAPAAARPAGVGAGHLAAGAAARVPHRRQARRCPTTSTCRPRSCAGRAARSRQLTGCTVTALNDQHAFLSCDTDAAVEVGDWVGLGLSHPCTTFDKLPLVPVVGADGETVVDLIRTYF